MTELIDTFRSALLGNARPVWVRPPRVPSTAETLTIFLDGEFYRDRVGAPATLDALQTAIADSWFVYVSSHSIEARWLECPCYAPFASAIVDELLPWLTQLHPAISQVRHRVLVGLSYTGLAAAYIARQYPGIFHRVISQSGSFWWNDCWLPRQFENQPPLPTQFYLEVGTKETATHIQHRADVLQVASQIEGVRRCRDALHATGHKVTYREFIGGHDFAAWHQTLPTALRWALA